MNNSVYIALLGTSLVIALLYKHAVAIDCCRGEIAQLQSRVWGLEFQQQRQQEARKSTPAPKPTPKPAPVKPAPQPANANQRGRKNGRRK